MVGETLVRSFAQRLLGGVEEVGVGTIATATNSPSQLMKLTDSERVGAVHDQGVGIGDVESVLDNRRTDQNIDPTFPEIVDHLLKCMFAHLTMGNGHPCFRNQLVDLARGTIDRLHPIVNEEDLALA